MGRGRHGAGSVTGSSRAWCPLPMSSRRRDCPRAVPISCTSCSKSPSSPFPAPGALPTPRGGPLPGRRCGEAGGLLTMPSRAGERAAIAATTAPLCPGPSPSLPTSGHLGLNGDPEHQDASRQGRRKLSPFCASFPRSARRISHGRQPPGPQGRRLPYPVRTEPQTQRRSQHSQQGSGSAAKPADWPQAW